MEMMMSNLKTPSSSAAKRVLRIWMALRGYSITGLSNADLISLTGESAPNVTRAITTLIEEDLVVKLPNGRFAHSVKTLQIALAHADHINRTRQQIDDLERRIIAGSF